MSTEGPIYNPINPNDYTGILNLYLRCPKKHEVLLNWFVSDYKNKLEYVINYLAPYYKKEELEIVKATAVKIVEAYCTSDSYSTLEDSNKIFGAFIDEYFRNLKMVADALNGTLKQGINR